MREPLRLRLDRHALAALGGGAVIRTAARAPREGFARGGHWVEIEIGVYDGEEQNDQDQTAAAGTTRRQPAPGSAVAGPEAAPAERG